MNKRRCNPRACCSAVWVHNGSCWHPPFPQIAMCVACGCCYCTSPLSAYYFGRYCVLSCVCALGRGGAFVVHKSRDLRSELYSALLIVRWRMPRCLVIPLLDL